MTIRSGLAIVTLLCCVPLVQAETWVPFDDRESLREFVLGSRVEFTNRHGDKTVATYNDDGTAIVQVDNVRFPRTWEVVGNDQVCYSSDIEEEVDCFLFEQNIDDPTEYRASEVGGQQVILFRVLDDETIELSHKTAAAAAGSFTAPSAAEIAAELANPNSAMGTMNTFFDYTTFDGDLDGADDADSLRMTFQPSLPYPLTDSANLFVRPLIPLIIKQDVPTADGFDTLRWELGDIGYDVSVFNSTPGGIIYGAGVAGLIPTATDEDAGIDQWLLGPQLILAWRQKWGVLGAIASHQWDVAGEDDFDTSITAGQYFYSIFMNNGWVFGANPVISYNHEAKSGNELSLPLGIGLTKTTILGGRAWKFGLQYWYYIESPDDFGPKHLLRFQISPVVKLPW